MKAAVLIVSVLAAIHFPVNALAQEISRETAPSFDQMDIVFRSAPGSNLLSTLRKSLPGTSTNSPVLRIPGAKSPRVLRPVRPATLAAGQLAPGVYESSPYTCIVVVPGAHPDDKACIGGAGTNTVDPKMPIITPDLRFIPRRR